jgi:hypothetical protein
MGMPESEEKINDMILKELKATESNHSIPRKVM